MDEWGNIWILITPGNVIFSTLYNHYYNLNNSKPIFSNLTHLETGFSFEYFKNHLLPVFEYWLVHDLVDLPQLRKADTLEKALSVDCIQFNHVINYGCFWHIARKAVMINKILKGFI